jgi:hypothetical protein
MQKAPRKQGAFWRSLVRILNQFFLPENGQLPASALPPGQQDAFVLVASSNAPRLEPFIFAFCIFAFAFASHLALQAELHDEAQDGASSAAPRLALLAQHGFVQSAPHAVFLAEHAVEPQHAGVSSAAPRLAVLFVPVLAQPAIASTRLIPMVLRTRFIILS